VFTGNPTPPTDQDERIKEDGMINLQFIGAVQAAGKTSGQLQKEIQDAYVPRLFQRLTVTVRTEERMFFVDGEVRSPGGCFIGGN
jgi:protein involved in polysaccharide export with SLBB domain